ncbi:hypothetical protein PLESTB_001858000 [Pleodorina starrii]|uniref:Uncharacterized protein n=1 Tax=Pleodorina starrii TaxID=330485 RepID=A0A9W6C2F7_9CHLO|nr:hypothetical protein PLESTB_001858000 [Pleodorina starrii]
MTLGYLARFPACSTILRCWGSTTCSWPATPVLFWLNSSGPTMLAALTLPLAVAAVAATAVSTTAAAATEPTLRPCRGLIPSSTGAPQQQQQQQQQMSGDGCIGGGAGHSSSAAAGGRCMSAVTGGHCSSAVGGGRGGRLLLVALFGWRSLSLNAAAVQRHHVVVWALFAPKLMFEVCVLRGGGARGAM